MKAIEHSYWKALWPKSFFQQCSVRHEVDICKDSIEKSKSTATHLDNFYNITCKDNCNKFAAMSFDPVKELSTLAKLHDKMHNISISCWIPSQGSFPDADIIYEVRTPSSKFIRH